MSNTKIESTEAKQAMDRLKNEVASELNIDLNSENITAQDAGRVGGNMTKKLVEKAKGKL